MKKFTFRPSKNISIQYFANNTVFRPNLTSELIVRAIEKNKKVIKKSNYILDLGCGSGAIGISIKKKIFKNSNVFFSDISKYAIKITEKNCKLNKINFIGRKSDLMSQWKSHHFDLIINDVSAISSYFSKKKIWYNNYIPSETGLDGTKQIIKFLKKVKKLNSKNIIIPIISLSNVTKIKKLIKNEKFKITSLIKQEWPMPKRLVLQQKKELFRLKDKEKIFFRELNGFLVANTEILYLEK